jgi:hypothetical protein
MKNLLIGLLALGSISSFASEKFIKEGEVVISKSSYLDFVAKNGVESSEQITGIYNEYNLNPKNSYMIVSISGNSKKVACFSSINGAVDYSSSNKENLVYIVPMDDNGSAVVTECIVDTVGILTNYILPSDYLENNVKAIGINHTGGVIRPKLVSVIRQKPVAMRDIIVIGF